MEFLQNQILGMKWLKNLIGNMLLAFGVDLNSCIGGSIQFFLYDTVKIMVLLGVMSMPAIVVNDKVVSSGKVLKTADVEKLLTK